MLKIYRQRGNYWSCSNFADWVRNTFAKDSKPKMATVEGWRDWKRSAKQKSKFVYWFTEKFLNKAQDVVMFPYDVWDAIRIYIRNRWVTKTHAVITPLSRGEWHENDEVMLFANFQILVDYIEIEKASMSLWDEERRQRYKKERPWWHSLPRMFRFGQWRSRKLGLEYLEWEMSLKNDDEWMDKSSPDYGKPTRQAMSACEQMELYLWWKDVRPSRPDPMDLSGSMEDFKKRFNEKRDDEDVMDWLDRERAPGEDKRMHDSWDIEKAQDEEDTEMLVRLIKIRSHLWT